MACIYKITNLVNDNIYIGKTLRTIKERWREHCKDYQNRDFEKRPLYNAMKKYGIENFVCELVEECYVWDLNDREIYWIEYYDSYHNGYNATRGGDGSSYVDYKMAYQLYQEGKTTGEIARIMGHNRTTIRRWLKSMGYSSEERSSRSTNAAMKPVVMLDKNTNEELKRFDSVSDAERFLGVEPGKSHIIAVCQEKRKTALGYKWKYAD